MSNNIDPQKFKSLQRQDWDSVAEGWKKWWKPIEESVQVVSDRLVELAQIKQGDKVLDVATGIGEPAVTVAKRVIPDGKVTAIDISSKMVAIANQKAKENGLENVIEFKETDAESLPSSTFDAIVSRFGLMFFPDLPNALRTMHEALTPAGRMAAAVLSSPQKVPFLSLPLNIIMKETAASPPSQGVPGPFSLADANALREKFEQAGFHDTKIEQDIMNIKLKTPEEYSTFIRATVGPARSMLAAQSEPRKEEIWNKVTEAAKKYADPSGAVNFDNEVIYLSAKK